MSEKMKAIGGLLVYVASAMTALLLASWMSTFFMGKAVSQESPPAAQGAPAAGGKADGAKSDDAKAAGPDGGKEGVLPGSEGLALKKNPLADIIEDYNYSPRDKRDPFQPFERPKGAGGIVGPLWPLQGFDLEQLHLVGIIWDVRNPKAMITDPTGKGYVVRVNERIGRNNGYIARIREGEIVVVESVTNIDGKLTYSTKLLKLQAE